MKTWSSEVLAKSFNELGLRLASSIISSGHTR
jgi:hypothetical protein